MKVQLGQECKDVVTGFKGTVVAITEWLNGCRRVTLQPKIGKDGKIPDNHTFDEPQLEVSGPGVAKTIKRNTETGGPLPFEPKQQRGPTR